MYNLGWYCLFNYITRAISDGSFDTLSFLSYLLSTLAVIFITMPIHEWAHGYVSTKLGDPTPRMQGRLTLNPMAHIDWLGAAGIMLFGIGWANPVKVNARYYKNPKWGMVLVAFAGPFANLILSLVTMVLSYLFILISSTVTYFISNFLFYIAYISTYLAVFNMIPIPPFDGSRILFAFLPQKYYFKIMQYERYIFIGLMALFLLDNRTGIISGTIGYISGKVLYFIAIIAKLPFNLFGV